MTDLSILSSLLGIVAGVIGTAIVQTIRSAGETEGKRIDSHTKLEEHWTDTTLELVDALRSELGNARQELGELRPLLVRLAHFEEALDHIHALLAALRSDEEVEIRAAVRRAQSFLSRMRGDEAKGEARQSVQTVLSAERIVADAKAGRVE